MLTAKNPGRRHQGRTTAPTVLIRSTPEWAQYLDRLCEADHRSRPNLIEAAVALWAEIHGQPAPPPRIV